MSMLMEKPLLEDSLFFTMVATNDFDKIRLMLIVNHQISNAYSGKSQVTSVKKALKSYAYWQNVVIESIVQGPYLLPQAFLFALLCYKARQTKPKVSTKD
jgi:hypothetical protein